MKYYTCDLQISRVIDIQSNIYATAFEVAVNLTCDMVHWIHLLNLFHSLI